MSTNSTISVEVTKNRWESVYCHWDGYLEGVGETLCKFYNTTKKATALVRLGSISSLETSIEAPAGHTFDKPVKGYTVAYARDRGEELTIDKESGDLNKVVGQLANQEFNYFLPIDTQRWVCFDYQGTLISDLSQYQKKIAVTAETIVTTPHEGQTFVIPTVEAEKLVKAVGKPTDFMTQDAKSYLQIALDETEMRFYNGKLEIAVSGVFVWTKKLGPKCQIILNENGSYTIRTDKQTRIEVARVR